MKKILQNNDLKMITEFYFRLLDDPRDYFEQLEQRFRLFDLRNNLSPIIKSEFFNRYNEESGATDIFCESKNQRE